MARTVQNCATVEAVRHKRFRWYGVVQSSSGRDRTSLTFRRLARDCGLATEKLALIVLIKSLTKLEGDEGMQHVRPVLTSRQMTSHWQQGSRIGLNRVSLSL